MRRTQEVFLRCIDQTHVSSTKTNTKFLTLKNIQRYVANHACLHCSHASTDLMLIINTFGVGCYYPQWTVEEST